MTTGTKTLETMRTTKNRALLVALLLTAMVAALVTTQAPAQASAFPGANGKIAFASTRTTGTGVDNPEGDTEIFSMNPDGTGLKQLTTNKASDNNPSYSADGKKIVFESQRTGNHEIFVMNADGTGQTNLTTNPATDLRPSFSPDGKKVLFDSERNGINNTDIYIMGADGTGQTQLTSALAKDANATFAPTGNKVAFVSDRADAQATFDSEIFTMNLDGTGQTPLTANTFEEDDPSFSPDGSKIAFASNRFGNGNSNDFDILVMGADGSNPANFTGSTARDTQPAFSPDGKKIAFASTRDGGDPDIFTMDGLNGTVQTDITPNGNFDVRPNWQPTATTFTVNTRSDDGDGVCNDTCTLREAITASNGVLGQLRNTIRFDIPGSGVQPIAPLTRLPTITRAVVIDGYTQPGSSPNTLATGDNAVLNIELTGTNMSSGGDGLAISHTSGSSIVRGLVINQFPEGISVGGNTVGSRIEGNFIGIDPTGAFDRGNGDDGVNVQGGATGTVVGGTTPAARNVISGNVCNAVFINNASSNSIQGNYIGTDRTGTRSIPNGDGFICAAIDIRNSSSGNTVGGTSAGAGNLISGNACDGVFVESSGNKVLGNRVGTTANGTGALGNGEAGVFLTSNTNTSTLVGDGTAAGSNTIAFNVEDGVEVQGGTGGAISRNSIFSNGESGIDLSPFGVTPNDGDNPATPQLDPDGDTGPNNLQNFPVLSSAKTSSTNTTVTGKLNSTPGKTFTVQFFSNPAGGDEGKTFLGQKSVLTDGSGNASFTFQTTTRAAVGQNVTATATDPAGNTSEFSAPKTVTDAIAPTVNSTSPAAGATGVSPSVNVSAVFSEAMNPSTINTTTVTLKRAGTTTKVGATVTYDATAKRAILNPKTNLKPGATYVATVTSGAKDVAGNVLDQSPSTAGNQPKTWQFKIRK